MPKGMETLYQHLKGRKGGGGDPKPDNTDGGGGLGHTLPPIVAQKGPGKKRDYDEVAARLDKAEKSGHRVHVRLARAAMKRLNRDAFADDD